MGKFPVVVPHGRDWHFLDEVDEIDVTNGRVRGKYHFRAGEAWLASNHFENMPIMPGVRQLNLIKKAARQTLQNPNPNRLCEIENVVFIGQVKPGDQLTASAASCQDFENVKAFCTLMANDKTVCVANLTFSGQTAKNNEPVLVPFSYSGQEIWQSENGLLDPEMVLEAMAHNTIQIAQGYPEIKDKLFLFQGIQKAEFGPDIYPSTLHLTSKISWNQPGRRGIAHCTAMVGQDKMAQATIEFACLNQRKK
ncbi:MAG: hypothetical protein WCP93_00905 [Candidatus Berkelbacteria bacterium]